MNTQTDKPNPLDITKRTTPISKMKSPVSLSFYKDICDQFSMRTWNSGGDHGIYINMHLAQFFRSGLIMVTGGSAVRSMAKG